MHRLDESVYYSPSDSESESVGESISESPSYIHSPDPVFSFVPNYILHECLIDLKMFNKLQPNTWVQLNSNQHFEPVGGTYSCLVGAQFGFSYFKGYTPELFLLDFKKFVSNVTEAVVEVASEGNETPNFEIKQKRFNEIHLVGNALKRALSGEMKDGGLYGLLKTHQKDIIYNELKESMRHFKDIVENKFNSSRYWDTTDFTKSQISGNSNKLPYWPEKKFKDEDWHNAMARSAKLPPESASIDKHIQYWTSSVSNAIVTGNLWNIIELPNKGVIILGPKPIFKQLPARNDLIALQKLNVNAVLSATEVYKMQPAGLVNIPITSEQWRKEGVKHMQVTISDSPQVPVEDILTGVEFIHWCLGKNETVLVHCEDDMNNSALIVMCYLVLYQHYTADNAFAYVQKKCPQAPIKGSFGKLINLYEFEEQFRLSWNCF